MCIDENSFASSYNNHYINIHKQPCWSYYLAEVNFLPFGNNIENVYFNSYTYDPYYLGIALCFPKGFYKGIKKTIFLNFIGLSKEVMLDINNNGCTGHMRSIKEAIDIRDRNGSLHSQFIFSERLSNIDGIPGDMGFFQQSVFRQKDYKNIMTPRRYVIENYRNNEDMQFAMGIRPAGRVLKIDIEYSGAYPLAAIEMFKYSGRSFDS